MDEHRKGSPHAGTSGWSVGALVCLFAAGVALLANRAEASFVLAALGVLAWFLNVRSNLPRVDGPADEDENLMDDSAGSEEARR